MKVEVTFNNRENPSFEHPELGTVWMSRAVAAAVILKDQTGKALFVRRGPHLNEPYKWCLPCGYLDYDETVEEAASRELTEETGLWINPKDLKFKCIQSEVRNSRQNVSIIYEALLSDTIRVKEESEVLESEEVVELDFKTSSQAWTLFHSKQIAFDHHKLAFS